MQRGHAGGRSARHLVKSFLLDYIKDCAKLKLLALMFYERVRKVQAAMAAWELREAFPMKLHVPLLLTVWASITCTSYKPLDAASLPAGWFDVPDEYTRKESSPEKVAEEMGLGTGGGMGSGPAGEPVGWM